MTRPSCCLLLLSFTTMHRYISPSSTGMDEYFEVSWDDASVSSVETSDSGSLDGMSSFYDFESHANLDRDSMSVSRTESDGPASLYQDTASSGRLVEGQDQYGCAHYKRRCKIRAPCCDEIFDCRHCHNEAKNSVVTDSQKSHDLPRHDVTKMICTLCHMEQEAAQFCAQCGVCMGEYFCAKCKFWDDDTTKEQFHCDGCGICRTGGQENFFHCHRCGCCYANVLRETHPCIERAMHQNCPVCFEFLFDSTKGITVMPCGHTMHLDCLKEMKRHFQFTCPVCSKSVCDMSRVWEKLDEEVAATPMPELYQNKMIWILCNDCGSTSQVQFHVIARKCLNCKSYNTRQIKDSDVAQKHYGS